MWIRVIHRCIVYNMCVSYIYGVRRWAWDGTYLRLACCWCLSIWGRLPLRCSSTFCMADCTPVLDPPPTKRDGRLNDYFFTRGNRTPLSHLCDTRTTRAASIVRPRRSLNTMMWIVDTVVAEISVNIRSRYQLKYHVSNNKRPIFYTPTTQYEQHKYANWNYPPIKSDRWYAS